MRVETNQVALLSFVLLAGAACTANRSAMPEREAAMFAGGAPEESELATPWIAPAGRRRMKYLDIGYTDQDGRRGTIGGLVNKPVLLTFFYSRCQNGAKCSMAVSRMASLQRSLAANGLDKKVRLLAVSYEPQFDTPDRIHRFGTDRGMQFGENAQALRLDPARLQQLIDEIEAPVNYNSGWVNTHGIELSLIDGSPDGSSANITPCCGTTNSCSVT